MQITKAQLKFLKPRKGKRFQMEGLSISGRLVPNLARTRSLETWREMMKMRHKRSGRKGVGKTWERLNQATPERSLAIKEAESRPRKGSNSGASDHKKLAEGKADAGTTSHQQPKGQVSPFPPPSLVFSSFERELFIEN